MGIHQGQVGHRLGQGENDQCGDDASHRQGQHQGKDHVFVIEQQARARFQPVQHHGAQEHGGFRAAGNAEGQRRDQRAAVLGVVGRFRGDDATDIALAIGDFRIGVALHLGRIAEERRHRAADAGHRADEGADGRACQHGGPVAEHVLDAVADALDLDLQGVVGNRSALYGQVDHLRNREQADQCGHQLDAVPQRIDAIGVAHHAGDIVEADKGADKAENRRDQSLQKPRPGRNRDGAKAEDRQQEKFWRRKQENDFLGDGDHQQQRENTDQAAHGRCGGTGADRFTGAPLLRQGEAVEGRRRVGRDPRCVEQDRRNRAAGGCCRHRAAEQHDRVGLVHAVGERDQQRQRRGAAEAGNGAEQQPDAGARDEEQHGFEMQQVQRRRTQRVNHAANGV